MGRELCFTKGEELLLLVISSAELPTPLPGLPPLVAVEGTATSVGCLRSCWMLLLVTEEEEQSEELFKEVLWFLPTAVMM